VTARGTCTGSVTSNPAKACNFGSTVDKRGDDPKYAAPTAPVTPKSVPACSGKNKLVEFSPGLYTDLNSLNKMMDGSGCKDSIYWFHPGTYYFDFSGEWLIDSGYLVGGTEAPGTKLVAGQVPAIPGSCWTPIPPSNLPPGGSWLRQPAGGGVQFAFGGASRIHVGAAKVEICGTYATDSPPIAVYGLKDDVGTGAAKVSKQSGCVTTTPYPSKTACAVITSDNAPNSSLYIQGTTYVPWAAVDVGLNNMTGQVFRYGVISRSLYLSATGSVNLGNAVIEVPDDSPGYALRTVVYLNVYVCPGANVCTAAAGTLRLRAKVGINDPTGTPVAGQREITVYNWSVQR
jgi:hypothetical protein